MLRSIVLAAAIVSAVPAVFAPVAFADDVQARRELLPTGTLRVGIGVGPAKTAFWSANDPASGRPSGVSIVRTFETGGCVF